jgi:hypothetical protein
MLEITKAPPIRISVLAAEIIYQLRSAGAKGEGQAQSGYRF